MEVDVVQGPLLVLRAPGVRDLEAVVLLGGPLAAPLVLLRRPGESHVLEVEGTRRPHLVARGGEAAKPQRFPAWDLRLEDAEEVLQLLLAPGREDGVLA
eukprot:2072855-Alexandrium_andersonii.AAC.1